MTLAQDIVEKVNQDFNDPVEAALVLSVLADYVDQNPDLSSNRILRCIVFVAKGDLGILDKAITLSKIDYRDLIVWAEYDKNFEQIRDLSIPFES